MSNKNEIFEYLIDQLRQQVNNNQCEDLVHEVQSLKNQLRDMSEVVDELQEDNIKKSEHISHLTYQTQCLSVCSATPG
jgi:predicted  nucleic acid-binding Zn-ribbon protein